MSEQLINRSPDLCQLRDEGHEIAIQANYLLMKNVPYLDANRKLKYGILVSELNLAGDATVRPSNHIVSFVGEHPCDADGHEIAKIKHQSRSESLDDGLVTQHSFSSKPQGGYKDYYDKMQAYYAIVSSPARAFFPDLPMTVPVVLKRVEEESVFNYLDTATSRCGINMVSKKLELGSVAIVGLGGTGSYVLDLVAKTPVQEIHLYDCDDFLQHNAFRSPGASSLDDLRKHQKKVDYFHEIYSKMRRGIHPHAEFINDDNVGELSQMDFVFLCLDRGEPRRIIMNSLSETEVPFIDVGMGLDEVEGSLLGILRITTSTVGNRGHVANTVPFTDGEDADDYSTNIQIAELNSLSAALAVLKWKKLLGFYMDFEQEHSTTFTIDGNLLINEDKHDADNATEAQIRPIHS